MTENQNKPNFWTTLPGILTGIAALLTAAGGLWVALHPKSAIQGTGSQQPVASVAVPPQATSAAQLPASAAPPSQTVRANKPQAIITEDEGNKVTVDTNSLTWIGQKEINLNSGQHISFDKIKTIDVLEVSDLNTSLQITKTDGQTINDSVFGGRATAAGTGIGGKNDTGSVLVPIAIVKQVAIEH